MTTIYVAPVACHLVQRVASETPMEVPSLLKGIGMSIERKASDQTTRSYCFPLRSGDSAKITCGGQDGLTILYGEIKSKNLTFEVTDDLLWIKDLPRTIYESYRHKSAAGELRVKDVVAFLPEDDRILVDAFSVSDEFRTWFQIKYNQASVVRSWPTWESMRSDV